MSKIVYWRSQWALYVMWRALHPQLSVASDLGLGFVVGVITAALW